MPNLRTTLPHKSKKSSLSLKENECLCIVKKIYQTNKDIVKDDNLWKLLLYKQVSEINCEGLYPIKIRKRKCLTWENFSSSLFFTHNFDISFPTLESLDETSLPRHGEISLEASALNSNEAKAVKWLHDVIILLSPLSLPCSPPPHHYSSTRFIHSCAAILNSDSSTSFYLMTLNCCRFTSPVVLQCYLLT